MGCLLLACGTIVMRVRVNEIVYSILAYLLRQLVEADSIDTLTNQLVDSQNVMFVCVNVQCMLGNCIIN